VSPAAATRPGHFRRGFTLVELGISSALLGVLMVSMASVVVLASKALPDFSSAAETGGSNAMALDQVLAELRCATEVTVATATSLEFLVADRSGDSNAETIKYTWAGTGHPLMRSYNAAAAAPVTGNLHSFAFEYSRRKTSTTQTTTTTWDSGEVLLASFNGWAGLTPSATMTTVSSTAWVSETFLIDKVTLPADTSKLVISRVTFQARRSGSATGTSYTVAIHRPSATGSSVPAASPVGTPFSLLVAPLSTLSFAWVEATFSDVVFNNASETSFCIVVKGSGTSSAQVRYLTLSIAPGDNYIYRTTTTSGGSWLPTSSFNVNDMPFFVYGSYQRPQSASASVDTYFLASARIVMQSSVETSSRIDAGTEVLNKPKVPAP
jgi:type II secretory pathway pseudopilin PulG